MSPSPGRAGRPRSGRGAGRTLALWAVRLAVVLVVFGLGVALGDALDDNPEPGRDTTFVRTLRPLPLSPARETVTVTVRER